VTFGKLLQRNLPTQYEPTVPQPSSFEVEIAFQKLKRHKLPGTDKIPEEMVHAEGNTLCSEIHKLSSSVWNKEELALLLYPF
jgi:hypothetical protein